MKIRFRSLIFGLYVSRETETSKRRLDYIEKTDRKIETYKTLIGYKYLFIFPDDLENNMEGLKIKLNNIK